MLFFNGFQNIFKLRTAAVGIGIQNGVFDGTEVVKLLPVLGEVKTGTNNFLFAVYCKCPQHGFLRLDAEHIKNTAGNVFADAAIGIGQLSRLSFAGRRKLQHIWSAAVFHSDFLAVCSIICPVKYTGTVCKVNPFCHAPAPFYKYFCLR